MSRAACRWRHSLPWIACLCVVVGCAVAAYTWLYEADRYQAVYTFYAQPAGYETEKAPLEASRMLARDCRALTHTEGFRTAVLATCARSDGMTYVDVRGVDGSHMLEVTATGPDAAIVAGLANAAGRRLLEEAPGLFGARAVSEITPAIPPQAACAPNRAAKVLWAVLAAFAGGSLMGLLWGSERQPVRFDGPEATALRAPRLGAVADIRRARKRFERRVQKKRETGMLLDGMERLVRENVRALVLRLRAQEDGAIVVTALRREDGGAALTALLAGELARQGFRVMAVEMDGREASLAELLNATAQVDLLDYLRGRASLAETAVKTRDGTLCFIDCLHAGESIANMAATPGFAAFLKSARANFDYVLLNAAPLENCADAALLGTLAGQTVLAGRDGAYTAEEWNAATEDLQSVVRRVSGVVLTQVRPSRFRMYD